MQLDVVVAGDQRRPFGLGLLDAIFPEHALAGGDHRRDGLGAEGFRDGNQCDRCRIAPGVAAGSRDLIAHGREAAQSAYSFHLVNVRHKSSNLSKTAKATFTYPPRYLTGDRGCTMLDDEAKARKPPRAAQAFSQHSRPTDRTGAARNHAAHLRPHPWPRIGATIASSMPASSSSSLPSAAPTRSARRSLRFGPSLKSSAASTPKRRPIRQAATSI